MMQDEYEQHNVETVIGKRQSPAVEQGQRHIGHVEIFNVHGHDFAAHFFSQLNDEPAIAGSDIQHAVGGLDEPRQMAGGPAARCSYTRRLILATNEAGMKSPGRLRRSLDDGSNIKQEVHDVAVVQDVALALGALFPRP